ncbi:MAG: chorismate synthase [Muribaculaceae bacterium]|nr:chorismate synthase [Muribaculaceae bacterium]
MNTFGTNFRLTTYGESHGAALGGIVDGMPPGVKLDMQSIQSMLDRRRTGRDTLTSQRREEDVPEILSGITGDGVTLGTPIGFIFRNKDARSGDYREVEHRYRPNHADYCYEQRYGLRDARGGGRSSARETVCRVMGGALAMQALHSRYPALTIEARVTSVGGVGYDDVLRLLSENATDTRLPYDEKLEEDMRQAVAATRDRHDSVGGVVTCLVKGLPAGVGNPVFGKLHAVLAAAMMSINAAKGFEYGLGCELAASHGSEVLDMFNPGFVPTLTSTNYSGGIQGGISNGMPIFFSVYFKPTPTISRPLEMPDEDGNLSELCVKGRHDPCVALRAPVIVESMAALTLADLTLIR